MSFFYTLLGACGGMRFYRITLQWKLADAFKYVAKLALIPTLAATVSFYRHASEWSQLLPAFSVQHGKFQTTVPQPCTRRLNDMEFVLDTTRTTSPGPGTNAAPTFVITVTADKIYTWAPFLSEPIVSLDLATIGAELDEVPDFRLLLKEAFALWSIPVAIVLYPFCFCFCLVCAVALSGLQFVVERWVWPSLAYEQLFRLAALALTPTLLALVIFQALGVDSEAVSALLPGVFAFYFMGGMWSCREMLLPPNSPPRPDSEDW